jgi:hypothetical protein
MSETYGIPEGWGSHQQHLVKTNPDEIDPEVSAVLDEFCASGREVEAAYLGRVEMIFPDGERAERWLFMVRLAIPVKKPGDGRDELMTLANRFVAEHPDLVGTLGIGALADRAVPAWEQNAVRVFLREDDG